MEIDGKILQRIMLQANSANLKITDSEDWRIKVSVCEGLSVLCLCGWKHVAIIIRMVEFSGSSTSVHYLHLDAISTSDTSQNDLYLRAQLF